MRAGCAAAVAGAVVLSRCIPAPVAPAAPVDLCPVLQVLTATALFDRVPPAGATPDLVEAIARLNAELGQVRAQIEEAC